MNIRISNNYVLKYELSFADNYKFTADGICINTKTGRVIKRTIVGRSIGYCIKGKFHSLNYLRGKLQKIVDIECPF